MAAGYSREQGDGVKKDGWTGNGRPCVPTARQAKRAGPDLEAGPEASAERSEGTMEARRGRDTARWLDAQHDSATGHVSLVGDALTSMHDEHHAQDSPHAQGIEELVLLGL